MLSFVETDFSSIGGVTVREVMESISSLVEEFTTTS